VAKCYTSLGVRLGLIVWAMQLLRRSPHIGPRYHGVGLSMEELREIEHERWLGLSEVYLRIGVFDFK
jgi:hypothetical protein